MAFIPVFNAQEGIIVYRLDTQRIINTLWFRQPNGPTAESLDATLTVLKQLWYSLAGHLSDHLTIERVEAHDRTQQGGQFVLSTTFNVTSGALTGEVTPNNVAACVSFGTGFGNRSARGRNYVAGIPTAMVASNTLDASWIASIRNAYDAVRGVAFSNGMTWCVASKYHNGVPRVLGTMVEITGVTMDSRVDSQRRRLPGYGT